MIIIWEDGQPNLTRTDLGSDPQYCVRFQASPRGIRGGQSSTGNRNFDRVNQVLPFSVIP
jgi:hypothetical protein